MSLQSRPYSNEYSNEFFPLVTGTQRQVAGWKNALSDTKDSDGNGLFHVFFPFPLSLLFSLSLFLLAQRAAGREGGKKRAVQRW